MIFKLIIIKKKTDRVIDTFSFFKKIEAKKNFKLIILKSFIICNCH